MAEFLLNVITGAIFTAIVFVPLSCWDARRHRKSNLELLKILNKDIASNTRLAEALEVQNRRKKTEIWNIRLLRQDIEELVKTKGGKW